MGVFKKIVTKDTDLNRVQDNVAAALLAPTDIATQDQMEAASDAEKFVTPGRAQYHPGACKAFINFNGTGTVAINRDYNVSTLDDNGVGDYTIHFTTPFSDANYTFIGSTKGVAATTEGIVCENFDNVSRTASALRIYTIRGVNTALYDDTTVNCAFWGDQ